MVLSLYEVTHWTAVITHSTPTQTVRGDGIITDLELPELERETDTEKRAGEAGVVPRPMYFNEMVATFTIRNIFEDLLTALKIGLTSSIDLVATACIQADSGTVTPYKVSCKGFITTHPFGSLSADGLESEFEMSCWYVEAVLGTNTLRYDPRNYWLGDGTTNNLANVKSVIIPPTT